MPGLPKFTRPTTIVNVIQSMGMLNTIFTRLGDAVYPGPSEQPCVLEVGAEFWMWFRPTGTGNIYLAKSADGKTGWGSAVLVMSAAGGWEGTVIKPNQVFAVGATYVMYYEGGAGKGIGRATSADGETWTREGTNPVLSPGSSGEWDDQGVGECGVIYEEAGDWKMLYKGYGSPATGWSFFGYATSVNGITWTKHGKVIVPEVGAGEAHDLRAIHFIKIDSYYFAFYSDSTYNNTYLASTANLENWVKHGTAIARRGAGSGAFDALWATAAYPVLDGTTVKIWYEGGDDSGVVTIGYAEVTVADLLAARAWATASGGLQVAGMPGIHSRLEEIDDDLPLDMALTGTRVVKDESATNETVTIHTVTAGKTLVIMSYELDVREHDAGNHYASLFISDGSTDYIFCFLDFPTTSDYYHVSNSTLLTVPAGWAVKVHANLHSKAHGVIVGYEIPA